MPELLKASTEPSLLQDEKGTHIEEALIPIFLIQTHYATSCHKHMQQIK
jgi:hypothetical protein